MKPSIIRESIAAITALLASDRELSRDFQAATDQHLKALQPFDANKALAAEQNLQAVQKRASELASGIRAAVNVVSRNHQFIDINAALVASLAESMGHKPPAFDRTLLRAWLGEVEKFAESLDSLGQDARQSVGGFYAFKDAPAGHHLRKEAAARVQNTRAQLSSAAERLGAATAALSKDVPAFENIIRASLALRQAINIPVSNQ
jgi:hypothetical protein